MSRCAWLIGAGLGAALPATAACPLPKPALQQGQAQVAWKVDGGSVVTGRHFAMAVQVCPLDATLSRVDATMPEHKHGMNYRPSLKSLGDGRWRVEGMMFHMPGRWALRLEVKTAGRTEVLVDTINLP